MSLATHNSLFIFTLHSLLYFLSRTDSTDIVIYIKRPRRYNDSTKKSVFFLGRREREDLLRTRDLFVDHLFDELVFLDLAFPFLLRLSLRDIDVDVVQKSLRRLTIVEEKTQFERRRLEARIETIPSLLETKESRRHRR